MGNPMRDAEVIAMRCTCEGDRQRMNLRRVKAAIDCEVCRLIGFGLEDSLAEVITALRSVRAGAGAHAARPLLPDADLRCTCPVSSPRLNFQRVTVIIDCGVCGEVALGISNADIDGIISTLQFIRDNLPGDLRCRSAS